MTASDPDTYLTFSPSPGINYLGEEQPAQALHQDNTARLVHSDAESSHKKSLILTTELLQETFAMGWDLYLK